MEDDDKKLYTIEIHEETEDDGCHMVFQIKHRDIDLDDFVNAIVTKHLALALAVNKK